MSIDLDGNNWLLSEVKTPEQLNTAEEFLVEAITKIQEQLSNNPTGTADWKRKAKFALRIKTQALDIVRRRQSRLTSDLENKAA